MITAIEPLLVKTTVKAIAGTQFCYENAKQCEENKPRKEVQLQKGIFHDYIKLRETHSGILKNWDVNKFTNCRPIYVLSQFSKNPQLSHL